MHALGRELSHIVRLSHARWLCAIIYITELMDAQNHTFRIFNALATGNTGFHWRSQDLIFFGEGGGGGGGGANLRPIQPMGGGRGGGGGGLSTVGRFS